jgi:hypothetical protein
MKGHFGYCSAVDRTSRPDLALTVGGLIALLGMFYAAIYASESGVLLLTLSAASFAAVAWFPFDTNARVLRWMTAVYGVATLAFAVLAIAS